MIDIDPIELFKDDAESIYSRINHILSESQERGYLVKNDIGELMGLYHTLKGNASMIEAYKFMAFIQDIESFLSRFNKLDVSSYGLELVMLCVDTADISQDVVMLEYEDRLEWDTFADMTNDILKQYNNVSFKQTESFFANCI